MCNQIFAACILHLFGLTIYYVPSLTTVSHSATKRSSCVARIMAAPLFAQSFSNETTSCLLELSSEAVGSSAKITEAFFRIALAIHNRCFSPPERTRALSFSLPCNPTISKTSFICPWLFPNFFKETLNETVSSSIIP